MKKLLLIVLAAIGLFMIFYIDSLAKAIMKQPQSTTQTNPSNANNNTKNDCEDDLDDPNSPSEIDQADTPPEIHLKQ